MLTFVLHISKRGETFKYPNENLKRALNLDQEWPTNKLNSAKANVAERIVVEVTEIMICLNFIKITHQLV